MKTLRFLSLSFLVVLFLGQLTFAQTTASNDKVKEVKFLTSATCAGCKANIEKAVIGENGVSSADLTLTDKVVTVKYDATKTSPDKIKAAIVKAGYKAELSKGGDCSKSCKDMKNGKCCSKDKGTTKS
jgi:copper chaperone CopZ